jgi:plasmid stabilization system protein ParE
MLEKPRKLNVAPEARAGIRQIQLYLRVHFGKTKSDSYKQELLLKLRKISNAPHQSPLLHPSKNLLIHKSVFRSKTIILYYFDNDYVHVISIVDARTNWRGDK